MLLDELKQIFEGKIVHITHTNREQKNVKGKCVSVVKTMGGKKDFDIVLKNGCRYGVIAEEVTPNSVADDMRKVEVIENQIVEDTKKLSEVIENLEKKIESAEHQAKHGSPVSSMNEDAAQWDVAQALKDVVVKLKKVTSL